MFYLYGIVECETSKDCPSSKQCVNFKCDVTTNTDAPGKLSLKLNIKVVLRWSR